MQTLLKLENGTVRRKDFSLSIPELLIEKGKVSCLIGKSGSGKSTVLLAIAGFVELATGKIIYEDHEIQNKVPEKRNLGLVFQKSALFPHLTVLQNVEFGLKMRGENKIQVREKAMHWLELLGIAELANKNPLEISGGQAQRVALARVLVMDYSVLLLDEPYSALDVSLRQELRTQLKELLSKHGRGALVVTHDPEDVAALSSHTYRIENSVVSESK